MSMQLRVVHSTGFDYDARVRASYHEARLVPQTTQHQIVSHTRVEVQPAPWTYTYRDYFGAEVTSFEVLDTHDRLSVTCTSTVHVDRRPDTTEVVGWEAFREPATVDRFSEFLVLEGLDHDHLPSEQLAREAQDRAAASDDPGQAALAVCQLVHAGVGRGAWSQEVTHRCIAALRSVGIPARYVSGYLMPGEPAVGESVSGSSHAWVEYWDGTWRGYDVTHGTFVGDGHVVVATGRDYGDVRPLRGIYTGLEGDDVSASLFVDVKVTRLS